VDNAAGAASANWLLSSLPTDEWEVVRSNLQLVRLDAKHTLERTGDRLAYVYFPETSVVSLVVTLASGASAAVAVAGREGFVGVSALLGDGPPPYDIVCQVPGRAARLPLHTFLRLSDELPHFRGQLLRYALALLSQISRTAACNGLHTVEQRLARWLLLCKDRLEQEALPLTHEALAHMLGARRPFVTHTAAALQHAGLIHYSRGTIRITDTRGLEAITCEDYRATEEPYESLLGWRPWRR
jgi:CRP-like cAMP-binding protein